MTDASSFHSWLTHAANTNTSSYIIITVAGATSMATIANATSVATVPGATSMATVTGATTMATVTGATTVTAATGSRSVTAVAGDKQKISRQLSGVSCHHRCLPPPTPPRLPIHVFLLYSLS